MQRFCALLGSSIWRLSLMLGMRTDARHSPSHSLFDRRFAEICLNFSQPRVLTLCLHICINIEQHECPHNFCLCNGVIHVPACICTTLRNALAYFSSTVASGLTASRVPNVASVYGGSDGLCGHRTANGERLNCAAITAAHRTLPFGTLVQVCHDRMRHRADYRSRPLCTR